MNNSSDETIEETVEMRLELYVFILLNKDLHDVDII